MFSDMFRAIDEGGAPQETFYDGYVVNAIMDACYRSAKKHAWEPVELDWRGGSTPRMSTTPETLRGPGRHQARDPARRPPQAHPQGPSLGRLHGPRRRGLTGRRTGHGSRSRQTIAEGRLHRHRAGALHLDPTDGDPSIASARPSRRSRQTGPIERMEGPLTRVADIRAAVIGTGFIGTVHVEALRRIGVQVRGVLGSTPGAGRGAGRPSSASPRPIPSLEALLADPDVDVVHVTSPNHLHVAQASADPRPPASTSSARSRWR